MKVIGGASTMSRQRGRRPTLEGIAPHSEWAHGCEMYVNGLGRVIDWPGGQHGAVFGYSWLREKLQVTLHMSESDCASYASSIEDDVAALLGKIFPDVEGVRFGKNGSDVCSAAVRLARAVTGRDKIAAYGYHGFGDSFTHAPQNRGVPKCLQDLVSWFEWNDYQGACNAVGDAACVIVEVPPVDSDQEVTDFLTYLRGLSTGAGALFILDEVVTGFRLALRGAAGYYRINESYAPDLYCWGKALSNGCAVSALGGRDELMREFQNGVFFSGTFFDDPLGMTAAQATLTRLMEDEAEIYSHLWHIGQLFKDGFNERATQYSIKATCVGQAPRTVMQWESEAERKRFCEPCLKRGVMFDRPQFSNMAMTEETVKTSLDVVEQAFKELA